MICALAGGLGLMLCPKRACASTQRITSILQVLSGTTINFESGASHADPNTVLNAYGITAVSDFPDLTTFVGGVTGTLDAPLSSRAIFGEVSLRTATPWHTVGMSGALTLLGLNRSGTLTITAYDAVGSPLGSFSSPFANGSTLAAYNASAAFMGVTSDELIYRADFAGHYDAGGVADSNEAWDNLTFSSVVVVAPEPASFPFAGVAATLAVRTFARVRRMGREPAPTGAPVSARA
jgi:hypothetical protein